MRSFNHRLFNELRKKLGEGIYHEALSCASRLRNILPNQQDLENNKILVAYGGGKDSSYVVAFVRFLQLIIENQTGKKIKLRVVTNRQSAMSQAVMENIDRIYRALEMYDPTVAELVLIDGEKVSCFDKDKPLPESVIERDRKNILFNGHRFAGEARSTFCNSCNLSMVNAFGLACEYDGGIDIIITGDSNKERAAYISWVNRLAKQFGLDEFQEKTGKTFRSFLKTMNQISLYYYQQITQVDGGYIQPADRVIAHHPIKEPLFFSIFEDTRYEAGEHWDFLTQFLQFKFDNIMFSFSESDCGAPSVMAHLRGLKAENIYKTSYFEGVKEYESFAIGLMRDKAFPDILIQEMKRRFQSEKDVFCFRRQIEEFVLKHFRLTHEHLLCLLYSPFTGEGHQLALWLQTHYPHYLPLIADIQAVLKNHSDEPKLVAFLERTSGFPVEELRRLYRLSSIPNLVEPRASDSPLSLILKKDPHKKLIQVQDNRFNRIKVEYISGR